MSNERIKSRSWCFTINNPSDEEKERFRKLAQEATFGVFQIEKGEAATPHLQGYIYFRNARGQSSLKSLFRRAHLEVAKGSPEENQAYCTKEAGRVTDPEIFGTIPHQGKRNDLEDAIGVLKGGGGLLELAERFPTTLVKYPRGMQLLTSLLAQKPRQHLTELWVFWGEPGTGKSRTAFNLGLGDFYSPVFGNTGIWWDGYSGQPTVILDEFKCNVPLGTLKLLADRNPVKVDVKGGSSQFNSHRIVITTNLDPDTWYTGDRVTPVERAALRRRISLMVLFRRGEDGKSERVIEWDDRESKTPLPEFDNDN